MMGYYYNSMMGNWGSVGLFGLLFQLELVVIGALVIAWLWKKLQK